MIEQMPTTIKVSGPEGIIYTVIPQAVSEQFNNSGVHEVHIEWTTSDGLLTGTVLTTPLHLTETLDKGGFFEPASLYKHYQNNPNPDLDSFWKAKVNLDHPKADLSQIAADLAKLPAVAPPKHPFGGGAKAPMKVTAAQGEIFFNSDTAPIGKIVGTTLTPGGLEIEVKMPDLSDGGAIIPQSLEAKMAEVWGMPFDMITVDEAKKKPKKSPEAHAEGVMQEATLEAVETLWVGLHGHSWPSKLNTLNGVHTLQLDDGTTLEVLLTVKPKEVKP